MDKMTVEQFIDQYYKPSRLQEPGRRDRIIADRLRDLKETGAARISCHEAVTGRMVTLVNPKWKPKEYVEWMVEE